MGKLTYISAMVPLGLLLLHPSRGGWTALLRSWEARVQEGPDIMAVSCCQTALEGQVLNAQGCPSWLCSVSEGDCHHRCLPLWMRCSEAEQDGPCGKQINILDLWAIFCRREDWQWLSGEPLSGVHLLASFESHNNPSMDQLHQVVLKVRCMKDCPWWPPPLCTVLVSCTSCWSVACVEGGIWLAQGSHCGLGPEATEGLKTGSLC